MTVPMSKTTSGVGSLHLRYLLFLLVFILAPGKVQAGAFTLYAGEIFPFTVVGEGGVVHGAAVDIVSELMAEAGMPVDQGDIQHINWARAVYDVETKPHTGLFLIAKTPKRENRFKWVGPIAELNLGLVAKKSSRITIKDKGDLKHYSIGVIRNSASVEMLKSYCGMTKDAMELVTNDILQFRMLQAGRVDMVTQADTAAPDWIKKLGMEQRDFEMVHVLKNLKLYLALNKSTDDELVGKLQSSLYRMKRKGSDGISRIDRILSKYLADGPIAIRQ